MRTELDPATVATHEELFEIQITLQSRLLDYIEQAGELQILDEAWDEFNLYEDIPMDPEDPEPPLHFFPWALFYWRRDVPEAAFEAAREQMIAGNTEVLEGDLDDNDDDNWLEEIEALSEEEIDEILSDSLDDDEFDEDDFDEDEDEPYVSLPPIATMFMNSVDGADGLDSPAASLTLSVKERQFIEAAAQAPYSFFKVNAIGPGAFVTLEDLIVPQGKLVYAQALVDMLEDGDVIYAQVVSVNDVHVLCAVAPAVLPALVQDAIAQASAEILNMMPELGEDWHIELEFEMRSLYHSLIEQIRQLSGEIDEHDDGIDSSR